MFAPKTYELRCHVCGHEFAVQAEFMSGMPQAADARLVGTCNMSADLAPHGREEIASSWRGRTAAQRER